MTTSKGDTKNREDKDTQILRMSQRAETEQASYETKEEGSPKLYK